MKDPEFGAAYAEARAVIDSTDALIRALDKARLLVDVSVSRQRSPPSSSRRGGGTLSVSREK